MREVVIDTETTGLSHKTGDRIVEVGCVELINHVTTSKSLQFYCRVDKEISESAQKITGITNKFLRNKKNFSDHCNEFLKFINKDPLIIHNAAFDIGFINNELALIGKSALTNPVVDTVSLARSVLNTRVANLDYLCRRFKIDLSERGLHGALLDSRLLAEVYLELKGGKQFSMNLSKTSAIKTKQISKNDINNKTIVRFEAAEEDINLHKKIIRDIKEPLWKKYSY
ncbi:DNA polymerase III subunit epsilon [Pelagibacterales bacterium SAG-MED31]|nr:DNA polymerase III subunit epsilon [Pelagibacterales bacterium SAG-MED31]